jgi:hypothetical protein
MLQATPTDGQPVTKFPNQDDAFVEITRAIQDAAKQLGTIEQSPQNKSAAVESGVSTVRTQPSQRQDIRSSNLRVKKQFSDHEKDRFLEEAFEYIATYFENSLVELKNRNPEIDSRFRRIDSNHFSAAVYINGHHKSGCRIWIGGRFFGNSIAYAASESGDDSSYNETLRVEDDGYSLFLKPMGMRLHGRSADQQLTNEGGADYLWTMFIEPLQV